MSAVKSGAAAVTVAPMEAVAPMESVAAAVAVAAMVEIAAAETGSVIAIAQAEAQVRVIIGRGAIIISGCSRVGDDRRSDHGYTDTDADHGSCGSDRTQA